jgi:hypothetical protein
MAMPFDLVLTYADGSSERVHRTPSVWQASPRSAVVTVVSAKALQSVVIDSGIFVDFYPGDNEWKAAAPAVATPAAAR